MVRAFPSLWRLHAYVSLNRGSHNTVHIDDLARNFALNPGDGLKESAVDTSFCPLHVTLIRQIGAFNDAHTEHGRQDRELYRLARYLVHLAQTVLDFRTVDHKVHAVFRIACLGVC